MIIWPWRSFSSMLNDILIILGHIEARGNPPEGNPPEGSAVNGAKIRIFWDRESAEGAKRQQPGLIGGLSAQAVVSLRLRRFRLL